MNQTEGFSLVELLISTLILGMLLAGGSLVLLSGQLAWSNTDTQIHLQENIRQALLKVSRELSESGKDVDGILQVAINDGAGINASDVLQFSVPICVCSGVMNESGDIANWGAPLQWGKTGCTRNYTTESNGKVIICHLPPGNPENVQTLQVASSSINAHFSHGDLIGACTTCSTVSNKFVEYRINSGNQLVRRVLNNTASSITKEDIFASNITDFQASLNADQNVVTLTVNFTGNTTRNREVTMTRSLKIYLRNK